VSADRKHHEGKITLKESVFFLNSTCNMSRKSMKNVVIKYTIYKKKLFIPVVYIFLILPT